MVDCSQDTVSGLQWHEPIEGLDFGEVLLGGIASTYLGRGRSIGYAIVFTDRRIIGVRLRRITQAILLPYMIAIGALYILTVFVLGAGSLLLILLPMVLWGADTSLRVLWKRFSERVVSRRESDPARLVRRKRDFEVKRDTIEELLVKNAPRGLTLGLDKGYLKIFRKSDPAEPIEIKIHRWQQSQKLRDLVIRFSSREPKVKAMEYPSRS